MLNLILHQLFLNLSYYFYFSIVEKISKLINNKIVTDKQRLFLISSTLNKKYE